MFFVIKHKNYLSAEQLQADILLNAYYVVQNYPLKATDLLMDKYLQQQYKTSLKNLCIKLLLNITFYKDDIGNLVLMFKNPEYDKIARLITYGNGAIPGSKILKIALTN
jgi:hypothetical protein